LLVLLLLYEFANNIAFGETSCLPQISEEVEQSVSGKRQGRLEKVTPLIKSAHEPIHSYK
jgi:hypothetical protein